MLNQTIHWIQMIGTVIDGLLFLRVLTLRLHRTYVFLTLFCAVEFLFDSAQWWLGWDSQPTEKLFFYSLFLYSALFPLMAWDIFEELSRQILKLRRAFGIRLVTGVFVSILFGLFLYLTLEDKDIDGTSMLMEMTGMVLWTGATSASLAFVWSLSRLLKKQKVPIPQNTSTWTIFFLLSLSNSLAYFVLLFFTASFSAFQRDLIAIGYLGFNLAITLWCGIRLRALPSQDRPATEVAGA